jgi:nucleoside-diphosphate-sugar epimerase
MSDKVVVTGAAGFIGSHLCEALVAQGLRVTGVDSFNPNYDVRIKRGNLASLVDHDRFELIEGSINDIDLEKVVSGAGYVFHLAAQAGVRDSWAKRFDEYVDANIRATQRLCEACRGKPLDRFVYASSSSVYGDTAELPMNEGHPTRPFSPYGVTKLSGEALCLLYRQNFGLPVVSLRFFTVYGPRQRPDMAFHKFIARAFDGKPIEVFGQGHQTRDFTYVSDIVDANRLAMSYDGPHTIFNIGGGSRVTLNAALEVLTGGLTGKAAVEVVFVDPVKGDVMHTYADIGLARRELGYSPKVDLEEGMGREIEWIASLRRSLGSGQAV